MMPKKFFVGFYYSFNKLFFLSSLYYGRYETCTHQPQLRKRASINMHPSTPPPTHTHFWILCMRNDWYGITLLRIITYSITTLSIKGLYVTHSIVESKNKWDSAWQCSAIMPSVMMLSVTFYSLLSWIS